jgi:hypothetical protein
MNAASNATKGHKPTALVLCLVVHVLLEITYLVVFAYCAVQIRLRVQLERDRS